MEKTELKNDKKEKDVIAQLRYLRISPRKVRLAANLIKRMPIAKAEIQLKMNLKKSALPILKLLKSAIANAENNMKLKKEDLYVYQVRVDGGPPLKRFRARAFGRAARIMKRTSHITIILREKNNK